MNLVSLRLALTLLALLALGALLASPQWPLPLGRGWLGVVLIVGAALWWRRRWRRAGGPEAAERSAHVRMKGTALVLGFTLASQWWMGPALALQSPAAQRFGADVWTLVAGLVVMHALTQPARPPRRDEHDTWLATQGEAVAHGALQALLLAFVLWLAFGPLAVVQGLSHAMVAQVLVCLWMASDLAGQAWRVYAYQRERALA